jgi:putative transposase
MPFPRARIRLTHPNYLGSRRYFITFCCFERSKIFLDGECCSIFLSILTKQSGAQAFAVPAYCLMPDHVHLLMHGLETSSDLQKFMKSLKQTSGYYLEKKTKSPVWQRFFHDHILRPRESSDGVSWYIWMNPVRGGICTDFRDYRYSGSLTGLWPPDRPPSALWSPCSGHL